MGQRLELPSQLGDDRLEQFGVKDAAGLREAAQAGGRHPQLPATFFSVLAWTRPAHAGDDGIEEEQQLQGEVLVIVQHAVAGLVALGGVIVQTIQQRQQLLEVLEALQLIFR